MKLFSEKHTQHQMVWIYSSCANSGECGILEALCYTRAVGQRRSLAESRLIPGNSREDSGEEGNPRVLVLYQEE